MKSEDGEHLLLGNELYKEICGYLKMYFFSYSLLWHEHLACSLFHKVASNFHSINVESVANTHNV